MLKTAGAAAAFTGFGLSAPNVIRANDKVVRYLGTATTMGSEIFPQERQRQIQCLSMELFRWL